MLQVDVSNIAAMIIAPVFSMLPLATVEEIISFGIPYKNVRQGCFSLEITFAATVLNCIISVLTKNKLQARFNGANKLDRKSELYVSPVMSNSNVYKFKFVSNDQNKCIGMSYVETFSVQQPYIPNNRLLRFLIMDLFVYFIRKK